MDVELAPAFILVRLYQTKNLPAVVETSLSHQVLQIYKETEFKNSELQWQLLDMMQKEYVP